jgi:hypothetical protein
MQDVVKATYVIRGGLLYPTPDSPIPQAEVFRLITGRHKEESKGKIRHAEIGLAMNIEGQTDQVKWSDVRKLNKATTASIQKLLSNTEGPLHVILQKWQE